MLALLIGGMIAAPIAAWLVRHIPPRILGSLVGGLIIVTNARTLLQQRLDRRVRRHRQQHRVRRAVRPLGGRGGLLGVSEYRKNRDEENLIIAEAEAAAHTGDEDEPSRSSLVT